MSEPEYPRIRWGRVYGKHFPQHTDGTSRFAKLISENLLSKAKDDAGDILRREGFEAERWGGAIAHTVKMLWEARERIARLESVIAALKEK